MRRPNASSDEPDDSHQRTDHQIDQYLSPGALARKQAVEAGQFVGFPAPESNYYKTPNMMTNIRARIIRNGGSASAAVILDYLMRHTWGYREYGIAKRITIDEFTNGRKYADGSRMDTGAGPSQRTIVDALAYLQRSGYIEVEVDDSDRGRIAKFYKLHMDPDR